MIEVSGIGRIDAPMHWEALRLGAVVEQRREMVPVVPDVEYRLLGVRWYGAGPFHRETVTSETTEATALQAVHAGDLIYNRLFAWKGSFGIVPPELDGSFASNEFPLFGARPGHDIRYVGYYFLQPWVWDLISAESTGATAVSRNRWKEERLRSLIIPVPPFEEQVEISDFLDAQTDVLRALMSELGATTGQVDRSLIGLLLERRAALITAATTMGRAEMAGM